MRDAQDVERVVLRNNIWITTTNYIKDQSNTTDWVNCSAHNDLHNKPNQMALPWVNGDWQSTPIWAAGNGTYPRNDPLGFDAPTPAPSGNYTLNGSGSIVGMALPNFNLSSLSNPPASAPLIGAAGKGAPMSFGVGTTWDFIDYI